MHLRPSADLFLSPPDKTLVGITRKHPRNQPSHLVPGFQSCPLSLGMGVEEREIWKLE